MIDVEFATLGIIRCNVGDSARLHLNALGREMGSRCAAALGVLWFLASPFLGSGYLTITLKNKDLL